MFCHYMTLLPFSHSPMKITSLPAAHSQGLCNIFQGFVTAALHLNTKFCILCQSNFSASQNTLNPSGYNKIYIFRTHAFVGWLEFNLAELSWSPNYRLGPIDPHIFRTPQDRSQLSHVLMQKAHQKTSSTMQAQNQQQRSIFLLKNTSNLLYYYCANREIEYGKYKRTIKTQRKDDPPHLSS